MAPPSLERIEILDLMPAPRRFCAAGNRSAPPVTAARTSPCPPVQTQSPRLPSFSFPEGCCL